jgi:hypothetical protein
MAQFKYIIVDLGDGIEMPIIFSKLIKHDYMAGKMGGVQLVKSAGFFNIETQECIAQDNLGNDKDGTEFIFFCYGESIGLKVKSRGQVDSDIIKKDYQFEV